MLLSAALPILSLAASVLATSPAHRRLAPVVLDERAQTTCADATSILNSDLSGWVSPLVQSCVNALGNHAGYVNPWSNRVCVAAAIGTTPGLLRDYLSCKASDIPPVASLPGITTAVYQAITGSTNSKVSVNQQLLVDLVYSSIQQETSPVWPSSSGDVVSSITPIFDWTATGQTIPFSHFSDWLKYSPELEFCD